MLNKAKIKLPDFMRKSISLVTATVLVLSSIITLPQLVQAEDVENVNYSVFDGMVSNEKPVSENWTFDRRDFSVHPSFLDSDANFSAPKAIVNDDHTVTLNWKSVAGADNYIVTVYNVNNPTEVFLIGTPISVAETTATINGLSKYDKINVQVAAYNNTTLISASMVRVTTVINRNDVYKVLYDGSSQTDITGTNGIVSVGPSGSSMKLAGSPDKNIRTEL